MSEGVGGLSACRAVEDDGWAGFVMFGLAEFVCIFAFWIGIWPAAFGLPRGSSLGATVGVVFAAAGAVGFYLAFQHLGIDPRT